MTALVVLPGLDGTATMHAEFAACVDPAFDSITVISYPPDKLLGYAELETLARSEFPLSTPFVLLGESFSGPIAISIAANPPPNLVGLVLSTTFAKSPLPLLSPFSTLTRIAPVRALPSSLLSWFLLGRWATPQLEVLLQNALLAVSPAVLRFRAAVAMQADASADLVSISAPVLYLRASHDRLLSPAAGRHLLLAIPQCTVADIKGPHLLLQVAPKDCAHAVADFVRQIG